ncbi:unannotated protein [freshwater metagenome]|uniref:Unannotated protein n=1 Tax=freshwater metagenome TaxID=449393 RepID=A0A6J6C3V2_9ZZZZ
MELVAFVAVVGNANPERKAVVARAAITAHLEGDLIAGDSGRMSGSCERAWPKLGNFQPCGSGRLTLSTA